MAFFSSSSSSLHTLVLFTNCSVLEKSLPIPLHKKYKVHEYHFWGFSVFIWDEVETEKCSIYQKSHKCTIYNKYYINYFVCFPALFPRPFSSNVSSQSWPDWCFFSKLQLTPIIRCHNARMSKGNFLIGIYTFLANLFIRVYFTSWLIISYQPPNFLFRSSWWGPNNYRRIPTLPHWR